MKNKQQNQEINMSSAKHAENKIQDDPLYVPTKKEWKQMSKSQRSETEDRIICALEREHSLMGETTIHFQARASATEVLRRYYSGKGKKAFIASDLHTLYPGEKAFYPDLLVVFDVEDHHRRSWNVHREKKGLDFVLEIVSKSSRRNDQVEKLNLFARLGIPEYFIFDPDNFLLTGYQLKGNKGQQKYHKIPTKKSNYVFSNILELELTVENYRLRFASSDGLEVLFGDELINRLNEKLTSKDEMIADSLRQIIEERKEKEKEREEKEEERKEKEEERRQKEDERKQKEQEKLRADKLEEEVKELRLLLKKNKPS